MTDGDRLDGFARSHNMVDFASTNGWVSMTGRVPLDDHRFLTGHVFFLFGYDPVARVDGRKAEV